MAHPRPRACASALRERWSPSLRELALEIGPPSARVSYFTRGARRLSDCLAGDAVAYGWRTNASLRPTGFGTNAGAPSGRFQTLAHRGPRSRPRLGNTPRLRVSDRPAQTVGASSRPSSRAVWSAQYEALRVGHCTAKHTAARRAPARRVGGRTGADCEGRDGGSLKPGRRERRIRGPLRRRPECGS